MIMDDDRIMKAAQLIANSSAALIQAMGMMSENIERANRGESPAYTEDQFMKLIQDSGTHVDDFPAEIRIFTDNGLICLSITSVYLSGEDNLMVDGYDDDNEKIEGVDVYYDQISEIVYLAKIILEKNGGKRSWGKQLKQI